MYFFLKKTYLNFELVCCLPEVKKGEFYPDAYTFFHTKQSIEDYFNLTDETREIKNSLPDSTSFDFDKYSYCIFYGKGVSNMYYSYKKTFFDDKSPSYSKAKRFGLNCVFIDYSLNSNNGIYIYRVENNKTLRGFDGI
jgi:hypothetical protein